MENQLSRNQKFAEKIKPVSFYSKVVARGSSRSSRSDPVVAFVEVFDRQNFEVLLNPDQQQLVAPLGRSVEMICPSSNGNGAKPICKWYPPYDGIKPFNVIDRSVFREIIERPQYL